MIDGLKLLACFVVSRFSSKGRLEAEIVILRHQLNVLRRRTPSRARLTFLDRLIFVWLYRLRPSVLNAVALVKREMVVRWHREDFRLYWRRKSRARGGRPRIASELRRLIREMSRANPLWGAPRVHGELLKLGVEVARSTVAKYMARGRRPPSQRSTDHPFPWTEAPRYLIRDRDAAYACAPDNGSLPMGSAIFHYTFPPPAITCLRCRRMVMPRCTVTWILFAWPVTMTSGYASSRPLERSL
jgi:hypothetical protein